jgi:hypothetical protein
MSQIREETVSSVWKFTLTSWLFIAAGFGVAVFLFRQGIAEMAMNWESEDRVMAT